MLPKRPVRPVCVSGQLDAIDLKAAGISTVVWATGFRYRYPWLRVPVFDGHGDMRQYRGITPGPWPLRHRPAVPAPARLQLHRRRPPRRPGHLRAIETSDRSRSVRPPYPARAGGDSRDRSTHDVIIVGARCAGSATAMLLARARPACPRARPRQVRQRHRLHPRTHARRRAAVAALGPARRVVAAGTPPVTRVVFHYPEETTPICTQAGRRRPCAVRASPHRPGPGARGRRDGGRGRCAIRRDGDRAAPRRRLAG